MSETPISVRVASNAASALMRWRRAAIKSRQLFWGSAPRHEQLNLDQPKPADSQIVDGGIGELAIGHHHDAVLRGAKACRAYSYFFDGSFDLGSLDPITTAERPVGHEDAGAKHIGERLTRGKGEGQPTDTEACQNAGRRDR